MSIVPTQSTRKTQEEISVALTRVFLGGCSPEVATQRLNDSFEHMGAGRSLRLAGKVLEWAGDEESEGLATKFMGAVGRAQFAACDHYGAVRAIQYLMDEYAGYFAGRSQPQS